MHRCVLALIVFSSVPGAVSASLTPRQMAGAEHVPAVTVPSPAEFFGAIDKTARPDWASFYRDPGPASFPARPQTAFNLGVLVTDGYVAVEAQDGQQVRNTGKEIIALARALGVGEDVLARGKSIADFADRNDWFALREELEATTNEVRRAMAGQRDEGLSALITAGAWLRALQVGSRAAELAEEESCTMLLRQPDLVAYLRLRLDELPEKARGGPVVTRVGQALETVREAMTVESGGVFDAARAGLIHRETAQLVEQLGARE
jgi:hypothetical protein